MSILLVNNNDSFTYNIIDVLRGLDHQNFQVVLSSKITPAHLNKHEKIIISPGPGKPQDFPNIKKVIAACKKRKSLLGICLGHQAICEFFGGNLIRQTPVSHGQKHTIHIDNKNTYLYKGLAQTIEVGLYHSWAVDTNSLPSCLNITGSSDTNTLMSVSHVDYDIHAIQFHPESFMTPTGSKIISNFLQGKS